MLGSLVRQATTRTRSEISREKRVFGLRLPAQEVAEAAQDDRAGDRAGAEGVADGLVAGLAEDPGDVLGPGLEGLGRDAAAAELLAQAEQVPLPHRLVVGQERDAGDARHALDLDAGAAADADVDVLAGGAHAGPDLPGAADEAAEDLGDLGDLLRACACRGRSRSR